MIYIIQNKSELDEKIAEAGDLLVVIDFFATWCGPCKIISAKLEELAEEYKGKAIVVKVDVDDCEDIAMEYNIVSMPTFVFIKNKDVVAVVVGANNENLMKNMAKFVTGDVPPKKALEEEMETDAEFEAVAASGAIVE